MSLSLSSAPAARFTKLICGYLGCQIAARRSRGQQPGPNAVARQTVALLSGFNRWQVSHHARKLLWFKGYGKSG